MKSSDWNRFQTERGSEPQYKMDVNFIPFPTGCKIALARNTPRWGTTNAEIKDPLVGEPRALKGSDPSFKSWSRNNTALHNTRCLLPGPPAYSFLPSLFILLHVLQHLSKQDCQMSGTMKRLWLAIRWIVFRPDITATLDWALKSNSV